MAAMQENSYPGAFIVFEGIDGAGKTTQALKLLRYLQAHDSVVYTKEPTYKMPIGNKIRKVISGDVKLSPLKLQQLFIQDRDEHLYRYIIPKLGLGQTVICDRYFLSSVAYGSLDIDMDRLIAIHEKLDDFIIPDITIIIDVDPKMAIERTKVVHFELDIFEKKEKLLRVRKAYHILARRFDNVHVVDGERDEDKIFEDVKKLTDKVLRHRRIFEKS